MPNNEKYVRVSDLNKCETCRHHRTGRCDTWCDYGEAYQIDWRKVKKVDAVEVVRCKDCVRARETTFDEKTRYCRRYREIFDENDFCSYGERKTP